MLLAHLAGSPCRAGRVSTRPRAQSTWSADALFKIGDGKGGRAHAGGIPAGGRSRPARRDPFSPATVCRIVITKELDMMLAKISDFASVRYQVPVYYRLGSAVQDRRLLMSYARTRHVV